MDLYIYYRVARGNSDMLQARILRMQAELSRQYGVTAALKRRPHEDAGQYTWMEVYLSVPGDFENKLQRAVLEAELPALIDGERHIERFVDITSCA